MISGSAISNKNSFCINPQSGRPIKIGGNRWRQLVRNNEISPKEEAENVVYRIKSSRFQTDKEAIDHLQEEKERIIGEIRRGLHGVPSDTNVVRRGTTRLVYQRKKISIDEIVNKAVTAACHILDEIRMGELELDEGLNPGQRQAVISNAIIARMASPPAYHHIPRMMPTVCESEPLRTQYETDTDGYTDYSSSDDE